MPSLTILALRRNTADGTFAQCGKSMSALGQKQTCAAQNVMSALPPKADMCGATRDVRFVPIADIRHAARICASVASRTS